MRNIISLKNALILVNALLYLIAFLVVASTIYALSLLSFKSISTAIYINFSFIFAVLTVILAVAGCDSSRNIHRLPLYPLLMTCMTVAWIPILVGISVDYGQLLGSSSETLNFWESNKTDAGIRFFQNIAGDFLGLYVEAGCQGGGCEIENCEFPAEINPTYRNISCNDSSVGDQLNNWVEKHSDSHVDIRACFRYVITTQFRFQNEFITANEGSAGIWCRIREYIFHVSLKAYSLVFYSVSIVTGLCLCTLLLHLIFRKVELDKIKFL